MQGMNCWKRRQVGNRCQKKETEHAKKELLEVQKALGVKIGVKAEMLNTELRVKKCKEALKQLKRQAKEDTEKESDRGTEAV